MRQKNIDYETLYHIKMKIKTKTLLLLACLMASLAATAQDRLVTGQLFDTESKEPVEQASVQLYSADSTYIGGTLSNGQGVFKLSVKKDGLYKLRISSVGYQTIVKRIRISDGKNLTLGKLDMKADAVVLKETQVIGKAVKVTVKEDTFIYNSAAYRTPEGSTIEELVKQLPGVEVDESGKITHNGKQVKKILVDGKEFMTGDTKIAMKNLPTSIVEKVKAYDEKSDLARITGVDDGEETTVLDFGLKKGMNRGTFANIDLGIGNHSRYSEKGMGAYFDDKNRFMVFGSANNVNDTGFPGGGRGRFGAGRQGLNAAKMLGINYNYEIVKKLKIDLSGFWQHNDGDAFTRNSSENFVSTTGAFSNSIQQNYSRSDSWNIQGRLEWQPDTMTNIMFRPSLAWSKNDGRTASTSATFNADPYLYSTNPLDDAEMEEMGKDSLVVNSQKANSISYSSSKDFSGTLQINRKLNSRGRSITFGASGGYSKSDSENLSMNATKLWLMKTAAGMDSTYQTNRYNTTPTDNYNYRLSATYTEPLFKGAFLQFRYNFKYSHSKSDRATYDFSQIGSSYFDGIAPVYRGWGSYLNLLPGSLTDYRDQDLSRYSEYDNYLHEINVTFRLIRNKYQLNAGFMVQPQRSKYVQDYQGLHVDTVRTVTNFSPTFDLRYRFNRQHQLRIRYRGTTSQPSMTQLLDITDDSNPLDISKGNPGLKPSFTNNFNLFYNNFISKRAQFINANLSFQTTRNSISNMVTYDDVTGGRTTRPENINGNWSIDGGFLYNTSIDSTGTWYTNTSTDAKFTNDVGYLTLDRTTGVQKNRTRTLNLREQLNVGFRDGWVAIELNGSVNYLHGRNQLQSQSNLDTWQFSYGATFSLNTPWGTALSTNISENSRRGYNDNSMNTNELIWNAQISQGFLKGKPLTVMLQFYDLLHQQSNFSRTISAFQRSDTWYNSINSYAMLHVVYRFNMFGGKDARKGMRRNGDHQPGDMPPDGGRMHDRGGFGGPPPGGGHPGGGRPF